MPFWLVSRRPFMISFALSVFLGCAVIVIGQAEPEARQTCESQCSFIGCFEGPYSCSGDCGVWTSWEEFYSAPPCISCGAGWCIFTVKAQPGTHAQSAIVRLRSSA
jgi:hypothetical protein